LYHIVNFKLENCDFYYGPDKKNGPFSTFVVLNVFLIGYLLSDFGHIVLPMTLNLVRV